MMMIIFMNKIKLLNPLMKEIVKWLKFIHSRFTQFIVSSMQKIFYFEESISSHFLTSSVTLEIWIYAAIISLGMSHTVP